MSSRTMRAVYIKDEKGPAENLFIKEVPRPKPKDGYALVKIKAFGLNRMDLLEREGMYPIPPQAPKNHLGVEFSGVVEDLGATQDGESFKKGDEVFGLAYGGCYAEYVSVSTHMLIKKPKELSWVECAGIPETWITATQALHLIGALKPGETILWHAGASSVSIAGTQLSLNAGASAVYATARQDEKCKFCVDTLGCKAAFNTKTSADWAEDVLKATGGKGVDVIVDFIGASAFEGNLKAVARDGRIVNLGFLGGTKLGDGVDISGFLRKRARFEGSSLRSRDEGYQGRLRDMLDKEAMPKFVKGEYKVFIEKVFDWESVVEAHRLMESNQTKGKIICTIEEV